MSAPNPDVTIPTVTASDPPKKKTTSAGSGEAIPGMSKTVAIIVPSVVGGLFIVILIIVAIVGWRRG